MAVRWTATMTHTGDGLGFPATSKNVRVSGSTFVICGNGQDTRRLELYGFDENAFAIAGQAVTATAASSTICGAASMGMAEGEGFEPPLPVRVKRFSRPPVSTTHTSLRELWCSLMIATRLAKAKKGHRRRSSGKRTSAPCRHDGRLQRFPFWDLFCGISTSIDTHLGRPYYSCPIPFGGFFFDIRPWSITSGPLSSTFHVHREVL